MEEKLIINVDSEKYIISCVIPDNLSSEVPNDIFDPIKMRCYQYIDNDFIFDEDKYSVELENNNHFKNITEVKNQISKLKRQLYDGDYKIIKCYEAQLVGEELPYNIEEVHAERNELRNKINELEKELL